MATTVLVALAVASICARGWLMIGKTVTLEADAAVVAPAIWRTRAPVEGILASVAVRPGDAVHLGDTLGSIKTERSSASPTPYSLNLNSPRSRLIKGRGRSDTSSPEVITRAVVATRRGLLVAEPGHILVGDSVAKDDAVFMFSSFQGWRISIDVSSLDKSAMLDGIQTIEVMKGSSGTGTLCQVRAALGSSERLTATQKSSGMWSNRREVVAAIDSACVSRLQSLGSLFRGGTVRVRIITQPPIAVRAVKWVRSSFWPFLE